MLRIIIFSIVACILSSVIKRNCSELYLPFQIAAATLVLIYILSSAIDELNVFFSFVESMGVGFEIIKALIKASLITVGTKLGCDVCKENGNCLLGDIIEIGGKIMIFIISAPYVISMIKISSAFLR